MAKEVFVGGNSRGAKRGGLFVTFTQAGCYLSMDLSETLGWAAGQKMELAVDRESGVVTLAPTTESHRGVRTLNNNRMKGKSFSFSLKQQEWLGVTSPSRRIPATVNDGVVSFCIADTEE